MRRVLRVVLTGVVALLAGYVAWDRVEAYRFGRAVEAVKARGEPVDLASLDVPLPSAEHVEAARLYADAAARAREIGQADFRLQRLDVDTVVGSVDVRELEGTYLADAPVLQLLDRATTLPFAGFGDEADATQPGLQALNALAALRVDLLAYRGEGDAAANALIAAIGIQRTAPESFIRYLLAARQIGSLRILLRHSAPSAAALEALQRAFAALPDEDGLAHELTLRRARVIEDRGFGLAPGGLSGVTATVLRPFVTRTTRIQIEQFREVIAAAREPWPDKFATLATLAADAGGRAGRGGRTMKDVFLRPPNVAAFSASAPQAGMLLAARRVAVATLAVERYRRAHDGALPGSLDSLVPAFLPSVPVDPFTGRPIIFKAVAGAYLVYSTDVNRQDDDGAIYGTGSLNPMPLPRVRDFGIKAPLAARPIAR